MQPFYVFTLSNVPVFVSPWYFIILYWGYQWGATPVTGVAMIICITLSLLIHEFGHALTAKRFRLGPTVLLHGFGGLCAHRPAERDGQDALIVAAGPGAGLLFGAFVWLATSVGYRLQAGWFDARPELMQTLNVLIWINLFWSGVNLLPLWPLDGGQLFRLGLLRLSSAQTARRITHGLGLALAGLVLIYGLNRGGFFLVILAFLLGLQNYQALHGAIASGPVRRSPRAAKGQLRQAEEAFTAGDWSECSRICHRLRMEPTIPPPVLSRVWKLLGICAVRLGQPKDAIDYLGRTTMDPEVAESWLRALLDTGDLPEVEALLRSPEFGKLTSRSQNDIRERLGL